MYLFQVLTSLYNKNFLKHEDQVRRLLNKYGLQKYNLALTFVNTGLLVFVSNNHEESFFISPDLERLFNITTTNNLDINNLTRCLLSKVDENESEIVKTVHN